MSRKTDDFYKRGDAERIERVAPLDVEFLGIVEELDPDEQNKLFGMRKDFYEGDAKARYDSHYGHDLFGAIARGQHNRMRKQLSDLLIQSAKDNHYNPIDEVNGGSYAGVLGLLIEAAIEHGVEPEKIIRMTGYQIEDTRRMERWIKDHAPKEDE